MAKNKDGIFSVQSYYLSLDVRGVPLFPSKSIWISNIPNKICFFLWLACLNRIPTVDMLISQGLISPNRCIMCGSNAESANHLLLHCLVASWIWNSMLCSFGLNWTFPSSVLVAWSSWECDSLQNISPKGKLIWRSIPFAVFWSLWSERNLRIFEDVSSEPQKILDSVWFRLYAWTLSLPPFQGTKIHDWAFNWAFIVYL